MYLYECIYICGRELWGLFGRVGYGMGWCLHLDWIGLFFVDLHRYIYIYMCVCCACVCAFCVTASMIQENDNASKSCQACF